MPTADSVCNEEGCCCTFLRDNRSPIITDQRAACSKRRLEQLQGLLYTSYLIGLGAFAALDDVELYFIAFLEGFVAVELNGAVVDEDVRSIITA